MKHLEKKDNIAYKCGDVYAEEAFVVNPNEWIEVPIEEYLIYLKNIEDYEQQD